MAAGQKRTQPSLVRLAAVHEQGPAERTQHRKSCCRQPYAQEVASLAIAGLG